MQGQAHPLNWVKGAGMREGPVLRPSITAPRLPLVPSYARAHKSKLRHWAHVASIRAGEAQPPDHVW